MHPTLEQQIAVLDRAREKILANPEKFDMEFFHHPCGTVHCIAGWIRVNEDAEFTPLQNLDFLQQYGLQSQETEDFANALVPNFSGIFYASKSHALEWLESREYAKVLSQ